MDGPASHWHYGIEVYDNGPPPDNDPVTVTLCPEQRLSPARKTFDARQVTCRRCRELLDMLGVDRTRREATLRAQPSRRTP